MISDNLTYRYRRMIARRREGDKGSETDETTPTEKTDEDTVLGEKTKRGKIKREHSGRRSNAARNEHKKFRPLILSISFHPPVN